WLISRRNDLDVMTGRHQTQMLKMSVEVIDDTGVISIHIHLSVLWFHVQSELARVVEAVEWIRCRWISVVEVAIPGAIPAGGTPAAAEVRSLTCGPEPVGSGLGGCRRPSIRCYGLRGRCTLCEGSARQPCSYNGGDYDFCNSHFVNSLPSSRGHVTVVTCANSTPLDRAVRGAGARLSASGNARR